MVVVVVVGVVGVVGVVVVVVARARTHTQTQPQTRTQTQTHTRAHTYTHIHTHTHTHTHLRTGADSVVGSFALRSRVHELHVQCENLTFTLAGISTVVEVDEIAEARKSEIDLLASSSFAKGGFTSLALALYLHAPEARAIIWRWNSDRVKWEGTPLPFLDLKTNGMATRQVHIGFVKSKHELSDEMPDHFIFFVPLKTWLSMQEKPSPTSEWSPRLQCSWETPPLNKEEIATQAALLVSRKLESAAAHIEVRVGVGVNLGVDAFDCLRGRKWLSGEVIDAYIKLLNRRNSSKGHRCFIFGTTFFPSLLSVLYYHDPITCDCECSEAERSGGTYNFKNVKADKQMRRGGANNPMDLAAIFVPIHTCKSHWSATSIYPRARVILYYDSLSANKRDLQMSWRLREVMARLATDLMGGPDVVPVAEWRVSATTGPEQKNVFDCGVFAVQYMSAMSAGRVPKCNGRDVRTIRSRMCNELAKGQLATSHNV